MRVIKYGLERPNILVKEKSCNYPCDQLSSPQQIMTFMNQVFRLGYMAEEYVYLLAFNGKMNLLGVFEISHGTVNQSLLSPREIMMRLLLCGASSFVLVHNHPSGDCKPSQADMESLEQFRKAGQLMRVSMNDFLIIGTTSYWSSAEKGI